jgi:hypothetical protein
MEARALARLGDAKGCDRALAEAVHAFERRNPDNDPEWIRYFNEVELNAEFGHCFRDLGRARDAQQYATQGILAPDDATFARSDFLWPSCLLIRILSRAKLSRHVPLFTKRSRRGNRSGRPDASVISESSAGTLPTLPIKHQSWSLTRLPGIRGCGGSRHDRPQGTSYSGSQFFRLAPV